MNLFEGYGIELEYMIIDKDSLDVLPVTDEVIKSVSGKYENEVEQGPLAWSNELVLHVIELKTNGPAKTLEGLADTFHKHVQQINKLLAPLNGRLLPTAMHPWMDPFNEMKLWPHDNSPIYEAYNRIFDCRGHGWANLQSVHINLPFDNDEQFGKLHAAIRLVLPLIPMLAASSPVAEQRVTGFKDYRLEVYRNNQNKVPSVAGYVIPEPVFTIKDYHEKILQPMYDEISRYDKEGTLQDEWLNSRGAITRFDRNTIEIRLIDCQECPLADVSIAGFVIEIIKALVNEEWVDYEYQRSFDHLKLSAILLNGIVQGENSVIEDSHYLKALGMQAERASGKEVLRHLFNRLNKGNAFWLPAIENILENGTLSTRILKALDGSSDKAKLKEVYNKLADCIANNTFFK